MPVKFPCVFGQLHLRGNKAPLTLSSYRMDLCMKSRRRAVHIVSSQSVALLVQNLYVCRTSLGEARPTDIREGGIGEVWERLKQIATFTFKYRPLGVLLLLLTVIRDTIQLYQRTITSKRDCTPSSTGPSVPKI